MKNTNFIVYSALIFCFSFFIFSFFRAYDPDLWGHLKFGEYILLHKSIPYQDIYSFVETKDLWVNHEWFSEVVFAFLYPLSPSGSLLLLFKALAFSFTVLIPWVYTVRKSRHLIALTLVYLVIILVFSYGTAIRPQIFSYLFFAMTLFILEKYQLKGKMTFIALPVIFIFWVNSHGGVLAGLALVVFYCLYSLFSDVITAKKEYNRIDLKNLNFKVLYLPLILVLVLGVNPYTYHYYPYILDAILMKRPFVEEWLSVFSFPGRVVYFFVLVVITATIVVKNLKAVKLSNGYRLILLILLMLVSFSHSRHIPFFALACAFYFPGLIDNILPVAKITVESDQKIPFKPGKQIALIAVSFLFIYFTIFNDQNFSYHLEVKEKTDAIFVGYPVKAANFIRANDLKGNMITTFNWGEFIIYQLYPEVKVSFDGRYETVYPDEIVKANMRFINAQSGWQEVLESFNPAFVLTSRYDPVTKNMVQESGWPLVFTDKESFLFLNPNYKRLQQTSL